MSASNESALSSNHTVALPNEISALIIKNIAHDLPSLRNTALVCKDFATLAQHHIFQKIDIHLSSPDDLEYERVIDEPSSPNGRLVGLLRDPKSMHLGNLIRCIWIELSRVVAFEHLPVILFYLPALEILAISRRWPVGNFTISYPSSLGPDFFHTNTSTKNVGSSVPEQVLNIHTLFLNLDGIEIIYANHRMNLKLLGPCTRVVLGVDGLLQYPRSLVWDFSIHSIATDLKGPQLMFTCIQDRRLPALLTHTVPNLGYSICDLCIDIHACYKSATSGIDREHEWTALDAVLINRHEQGLLKRFCFRCTRRSESFGFGYSLQHDKDPVDRTILEHIERLLPKSKDKGFLEVDRATTYFEPDF
ncbi:hypothetical protein J3R30DRAFT_838486 [Lentinula aciculospora]|uniref:F-box domain-containing protein n=1 Tax=Lentinula aciculospora TaxID=153920 RepID=A0A9W9DW43_9AGAR|nr:hypothetical protein J3R30DRAFT_838486 [Lentinula aciculospora]